MALAPGWVRVRRTPAPRAAGEGAHGLRRHIRSRIVVVFAYWIMTLPNVSPEALEARMTGLVKMLIGVAIAISALYWRYVPRR